MILLNIIHDFHIFFDWPNGSIWSNLLASALLTVSAGAYGLKKYINHQERLHTEKLKQATLHHNTVMDKLNEMHKDNK